MNYLGFIRQYRQFRRQSNNASPRFRLRWKDRYPCLDDGTSVTNFDTHYLYHLAWAARVLAGTMPELHVDIGSSLHFISLVSAFIPVKFYDYRPAKLSLRNLVTGRANLMALPFFDQSLRSLSCMHVVEHVGLGRYGDVLDPDGDLKAMSELMRVLAPGGTLLFVVPVGRPVIRFNAHRIYSHEQIRWGFQELTLREFALIPDNSDKEGVIEHASPELTDNQKYGCGCFWFQR